MRYTCVYVYVCARVRACLLYTYKDVILYPLARKQAINTYIHAHIHTYIRTYHARFMVHVFSSYWLTPYPFNTYIHTYINAYIHTYMHLSSSLHGAHVQLLLAHNVPIQYIHTYIYTYGGHTHTNM